MQSLKMQSLIKLLKQQGIKDNRVLSAIASIPRELFVDEALSHQAYDNRSLPIGSGQTISQPYIVARMTELLRLEPNSKVLEIGTGSGYQTAILAKLVDHVCSVERIKSLQWNTKRRLKQLDIHNISTRHGNGWLGWAERGPFDGIIVTAAASEVPQNLLAQLANKGRLVIPVGENKQILQLIERDGDNFISKNMGDVRFVPLVKGDIA
ncbi:MULTISPECIES: protein-L-isoaspartate(D-aspartate) O-methyltransferase [unclassified Gilliamella]|uniref:protein-L-isoaspartate(D-aspartate) O-methyltransferase n=1 Tax=unclassified Gilliamella TaxID=2685620 RepID=UPI001C6A6931|nr:MULTISPECIES: protein-L-isoaspartate(D-aspartate) O-methyltransferase [unclassified Gilliamella]MCX8601060.1 protein-L-isoaspartate(D-aspartate) O-methyltransferase [Gilliamella sp. B3722]MCX8608285.1 protein-L-isoaspartate(D-aspartate) O-methyltransferase [Gilliamella sp. B3771]MCX8610282.1 protein-L-isoaspartate(D-aspartate) O-methyltransferase [Gilliamella sp. B3891]MCX8612458.1 protein-L-isoaspartate(D-aspartate) O-methyltransferase [Gilliamella sp. B3773]MCX8616272.1 protein-L-isoaspar